MVVGMKDNGGSAFPAQPIYGRPDGTSIVHEQGGMTLRDYFAAKAMQAYASDAEWREDMDYVETARAAYAMADSMLKARET
jgi:hypothetical protein